MRIQLLLSLLIPFAFGVCHETVPSEGQKDYQLQPRCHSFHTYKAIVDAALRMLEHPQGHDHCIRRSALPAVVLCFSDSRLV